MIDASTLSETAIVKYFIGVDVGGTTTTLAVGDENHKVLLVSDQVDTHSHKGPDEVVRVIVEQTLAALEKVGGSIQNVNLVGLATPGPATMDGVLLMTPNLDPRVWDQFPIRARLEESLRAHQPAIEVRYLGDGQAAALGEFSVRSRAITWDRVPSDSLPECDLASLFMAVVGTGLGGGAIFDGRARRGSEGRAGHVGHIQIPPHAFRYEHDKQLLVGNSYCTAESVVSLTGLTHQLEYRLSLDQWKDHSLNTDSRSMREKAKGLRSLAANEDPLALELFKDQAWALGITLLNVNYLGDYDLLVIGGGVCDLAPKVREAYRLRAEESYRKFALDGFRNLEHIEFSICGDNAGVIGALAWVYNDPS